MQRFIVLVLLVLPLAAQPSVYLHAVGTPGYVIVGASNTTPVVVQTAAAGHGLLATCSPADPADCTVVNYGVGARVNGACVASAANGIFLATYVDATHFSLSDLSGNAVAANGPWCDGTYQDNVTAASAGARVSQFQLNAQPRGWLDGANGTLTRRLALGTNNGLSSLVVSGNRAMATTTYNHGLTTGDSISVWGSGNSRLNNTANPYTVTVISPTSFTFPTSGVPNGTYSHANNTCGPPAPGSGTQDCLRISQVAYVGNLWYDAATNRLTNAWQNGITYKHPFDGGLESSGGDESAPREWAAASVLFMVDQGNTAMFNVAKYCINSIERVNGVNWTAWEGASQGGNVMFNDFAYQTVMGLSACYIAARDYLTTQEKQTFADKMFNDVDFPATTPCNTAHTQPSREALASGNAQAGSATTITLAANDAAADGYYVNNVVMLGPTNQIGSSALITAYSAATKVATVSAWNYGPPAAGAAYTIYATATVTSTAGRAVTTVTGYNTHFAANLAAGDAIMAANVWGSQTAPEEYQSLVQAVTSDTALTVMNSNGVSATSTPQIAWYVHAWQPGDCSLRWLSRHWSGAIGAFPSLYPINGGNLTTDAGSNTPQITGATRPPPPPGVGGNNQFSRAMGYMALDLAMADDDPRAGQDLAVMEASWWDWLIRDQWNYATGFNKDGANYSFGRPMIHGPLAALLLQNSVATPLPLDPGGNWITSDPMLKMYSVYPDHRWDPGWQANVFWPARWGAEVGSNQLVPAGEAANNWQMDAAFLLAPNSEQAGYFKGFISTSCCITGRWSNIFPANAYLGLIAIDPRIKSTGSQGRSFTQLPTQYLFQKTSRDTACVQTGWPCPAWYRGDGVISRTGWTGPTDSHVMFMARTYWNEHDVPEAGSIRLYKVGSLLANDASIPGAASGQYPQGDIYDTMPMFGGVSSVHRGGAGDGYPAIANITRWASANSGSWDTAYGDAGSRYVYAMADLTGAYQTTYNRVWRHFAHFKKPGTEEIIIQFDDIDVSNAPTQVEVHIHYTQNGETAAQNSEYSEGNTTCPGAGGCASLDSSRVILSQQDGGTTGHDPQRTNGLITQFLTPGAMFVRDDSNTYPKALGHTHRVSLCAGSSCGTAARQLEALTVHKVTSALSDTNLTAKTLSPDPDWASVETLDKVALFARNGRTPILANVQTDHSGTAQYLIAGLQGGLVYRVHRNDDGTDVLQQQPVSDSDKSLYFEAPAGSYSIFPVSLSNLILRAAIPNAAVGSAFQYEFDPTGSASQLQWAATSGALPPGLHLSPAGVLSGTPSQAGDSTFTVTAQFPNSSASFSASATVHVAPPALKLIVNGFTSNKSILTYGRTGLDASQACTIILSTQPDFSQVTETFTDAGGAGSRWYVGGGSIPLLPSTTYYARADCGPGSPAVTASFTTKAPSALHSLTIPLSVPPLPRLPVASVQLQYGASPQLGDALTVACPGGCKADIPASSDSVVYLKRVYLDAASRVLAASSIRPIAAGR